MEDESLDLECVVQKTGLNVVGEELGYDWQEVDAQVLAANLFGTDDSTVITRGTTYSNTVVDAIITKIFEENTLATTLRIVE